MQSKAKTLRRAASPNQRDYSARDEVQYYTLTHQIRLIVVTSRNLLGLYAGNVSAVEHHVVQNKIDDYEAEVIATRCANHWTRCALHIRVRKPDSR